MTTSLKGGGNKIAEKMLCSAHPKHDGNKRPCGKMNKYTPLKHLIKPRHTTSHTCLSDYAAISQHDSLYPVRSHLWFFAHVTNKTAFVDLMKL